MESGNIQAELIAAIAELEEDQALALVRQRLAASDDPLRIIEDCQAGLKQVGKRYEEHQYFLSGLIMGGEIFRGAMELVQPVVNRLVSGEASGTVLLGTVEGDIHDLGKNIVSMLLTCHRFTVYDLGVDVEPAKLVEKVKEVKPEFVGFSALITSVFDSMKEAAEMLVEAGLRDQFKLMIGGGVTSPTVKEYIEADFQTVDAVEGVAYCMKSIGGSDNG